MTTTYCYDYADRLLSSTNAKVTAAAYDAHGNTTSLGSGTGNVTTFGYDSSDRNSSITEGTKSVTYARDVQGRITSRTLVNGTTTTNKYAFTASGDTPDLLLSSTSTIVEKYIQLPGNVLLTLRPTQTGAAAKVFSLPNIHGDVMVTTDANGASSGTFTYDPFGNKVSALLPNNTATSSTYGWVGQHEKDTETAFSIAPTEMGARVYVASIGRFLQVDSVQGGTPNNYVYPPDAVNDFDLDGRLSIGGAWNWVGEHSEAIGYGLTAVGAAACIIATAGVCAGVVVAAAVAGGVSTVAGARAKGQSWGSAATKGAISGGLDLAGARKVKAVRWFGETKTYKSVFKALTKKPAQQRAKSIAKDSIKSTVRGKVLDYGWDTANNIWNRKSRKR